MGSYWIRHTGILLFRMFPTNEKRRVEFWAEAYNITNTPVFSVPASGLSSVDFRPITNTRFSPRQLQLDLKIVF